MARVPLTGGAYQARSLIAGAQRSVNLMPEHNPPADQAPVPVTHYPTPGLKLLNGTLAPQPTPPVVSSQLWVVGSSCELLQFPLTTNGDVAPTLNIQGALTLLTGPLGDDNSFSYAVDFDSAGNQYMLEFWQLAGLVYQYSIPVFAAGATGNIAPIRNIQGTNTGFQAIGRETAFGGLCLDGSAKIYVGLDDKIYKFPAGSDGNATSTTFVQDATFGTGNLNAGISSLRFDAARQWIWVSWFTATTRGINAYDLSGVVQRQITDTGLSQPFQVTIGPDLSVMVVDTIGNNCKVFVYDPSANGVSTPTRTITTPIFFISNAARGLACDSAGRIYVATGHGLHSVLYVYAAGASDALGSAPIQTISGASTNFDAMLPTSVPPNAGTSIQQLNIR